MNRDRAIKHLLTTLENKGARLELVAEDRIKVYAPLGAIDFDLQGRIAELKDELVHELLQAAREKSNPENLGIIDLQAYLQGEGIVIPTESTCRGLYRLEFSLPLATGAEDVRIAMLALERAHPVLAAHLELRNERWCLVSDGDHAGRLTIIDSVDEVLVAERMRAVEAEGLSLQENGLYRAWLVPASKSRRGSLRMSLFADFVDRESLSIVRAFLRRHLFPSQTSPTSGETPNLSYLQWLRDYREKVDIEALAYWRGEALLLKRCMEVEAVGDLRDTGPFTWESFRITSELSSELAAALQRIRDQGRRSLAATCLAALLMAFAQRGNGALPAISVRVTRRVGRHEIEAVGRFENQVFLVLSRPKSLDYESVYLAIREKLISALSNANVPLTEVLATRTTQSGGYSPETSVGYLQTMVDLLPPPPPAAGSADRDLTLALTLTNGIPAQGRFVLNCYRGTISRLLANQILSDLIKALEHVAFDA